MQEKLRFLSYALTIVAVGLLIVGLKLAFHDRHINVVANRYASQLVYNANHNINSAAPATNEPKPSEFANYSVAPNLPRYLFISKLSVRAIIKPLGLTSKGLLATPNNVNDTGWFRKSSTPGQLGATVIDGHVSSWTTNGVFYGLNTLQKGDPIQIERGDGTIVYYSVVRKQTYTYQQVDMSAVLSPVQAGKSGLNLITCSGDIIKGTNDFTERIVIYAAQI